MNVPPVPAPLSVTPVPANTPPTVLGVNVTSSPAQTGLGAATKQASKAVPSMTIIVMHEISEHPSPSTAVVVAGNVPHAGLSISSSRHTVTIPLILPPVGVNVTSPVVMSITAVALVIVVVTGSIVHSLDKMLNASYAGLLTVGDITYGASPALRQTSFCISKSGCGCSVIRTNAVADISVGHKLLDGSTVYIIS